MFIRNKTTLDVQLARGHVSDELAVAAVMVFVDARTSPPAIGSRRSRRRCRRPRATRPRDRLRVPLWVGVSVTASGHVAGPARAPFVCPGALPRRRGAAAGRRARRSALGARRRRGPPAPSAPARFDRMRFAFDRAFGGGYDLPPGLLPGDRSPPTRAARRLPAQPGRRRVTTRARRPPPARPCRTSSAPMRCCGGGSDAPEPAGFAPCPDLVAWRMKDEQAAAAQRGASLANPAGVFQGVLRMSHHAPPSLLFDDVPEGTPIVLSGLGERAIRFACPAVARAGYRPHGQVSASIRPRLRALHVDADRRAVRAVFGHAFRVRPAERARLDPRASRRRRCSRERELSRQVRAGAGVDLHTYFMPGRRPPRPSPSPCRRRPTASAAATSRPRSSGASPTP